MSFINNKKFQPVLIVLVLSLWIYIGYRVFQSISFDEEVLEPISFSRMTRLSESNEGAVWTSEFKFRDPFVIEKTKKSNSYVQKNQKPKDKKKDKIEKPAISINIQFSGLIKDSNKDQQLAMLIYQGKTVLAEQGFEIDGYKLAEISSDSIIFHHKEYVYVVRR